MSRLTPAQLRGLALLATPGAVARGGTPSRWRVYGLLGDVIGSIHSESLGALRSEGFVAGDPALQQHVTRYHDIPQSITPAGRAYLRNHAPASPAADRGARP